MTDLATEDLAAATTAWADRAYDAGRGLLWNPAGSFLPEVPDRSVHLVPQSAWYALGLLDRDAPGDIDRARRVIDAVLDLQYDRPGTPWHGTFARVAESPEPTAGAVEWVDYDPNWRQFVGTAWLLLRRHHDAALSPDRRRRIDRSLRRCVEGEPPDRVDARYTNIAGLRAALEVEAGVAADEPAWVDRGLALAEALSRTGFAEFNSPTYYGIDLLAFAFCRTSPASDRLRAIGAELEVRLWRDVAERYHAGLGNLCGPYSRAYGLDLHRSVGALALWLWPVVGRDHTPLPDLGARTVDHGHDLCLGPLVARLTAPPPPEVAVALTGFGRSRSGDAAPGGDPARRATWSLGERVMLGGESWDGGPQARGQYHPATAHWAAPDGVGVLSVRSHRPLSGTAEGDRLEVRAPARPGRGDDLVCAVEVAGADGGRIAAGRWSLPGVEVSVETDRPLLAVESLGGRILVRYEGTEAAAVLTLRVRPG